MPFVDNRTSRNRFGRQRSGSPVPESSRPQGWDSPIEVAPILPDLPPQGASPMKAIAVVGGLFAVPLIAAAAFSGSSYSRTSQGCVDEKGIVVEDSYCRTTGRYHRHYGGTYRSGFPPSGGSYLPPSSSSTVRGGFGRIGSIFSGGS